MPARAHAQYPTSIDGGPEKQCFRQEGSSVFEALRLKLAIIEDEVNSLRLLVYDARHQALDEIRETRLLLRDDAARLLALSLSQLDRLTKDGQIPVTYLDNRPRYSLADLQEFREARTLYPQVRGLRKRGSSSPANKSNVQQDLSNSSCEQGSIGP